MKTNSPRENNKPHIASIRGISLTKFQTKTAPGDTQFWGLWFGASLGFGFWVLALLPWSNTFGQGSLTPSGAPSPTMKSLDQVASTGIAVNATNTPGDNNNQFIINQPGSYYLTGKITGVSGKSAIAIQADNVTLDLNGFAMIGVGGASSAIQVPNAQKNLRVHNGVVQGWGSTAVLMFNATASQVENLRVSDSGGSGVLVGNDSTANKCIVVNSGSYGVQVGTGGRVLDCTIDVANNGISTGDKSAISGCIVRACATSGFVMGEACTASRCLASDNGSYGFSSGDRSGFTDCTARGNLNHGLNVANACKLSGCVAAINTGVNTNGISCSASCTLQNCAATSNGSNGIQTAANGSISNCSSQLNGGAGIVASSGSVIIGCAAGQNTGVGISAPADSLVKNCAAYSNTSHGISVGSNVEVIGNRCDFNGPFLGTVAGIRATLNGNRIENNTMTGNNNTGLEVDFSGNFIARNSASNNSNTNYNIVANNKVGTIVAAPNSGAINGNTGGAGVGTTDPWANFSF